MKKIWRKLKFAAEAAATAFRAGPESSDLDFFRLLGKEFAEGVGKRFKGWPDRVYNPDDLLTAKGKTCELYLEMMRDDMVRAAILKKALAVCGLDREIVAADKSPEAQKAAAFMRWVLFDNLKGTFGSVLFQMLSAALAGYSLHEMVYDVAESGPWAGRVVVTKLKHRDPSDFWFKTDRALNVTGLKQRQQRGPEIDLDHKKFLIYSYLQWFSNPYGQADGRAVYRPFIIKDMAWKMRAIYVEKFGVPSLVGKYPGGKATEAQKSAFLEAVQRYQSDTGILIPADLALDTLEISTQGNTTFGDAIKDLNDSICTAVLLGFLQMGEGKNTGALRMGEVHQASENVFVDYLAEDVAEVFNEQVIAPLVKWNFGDVPCPYLAIRPAQVKDVQAELSILQGAQGIGLDIAEAEAYERLGLKQPEPTDSILQPRGGSAGVSPAFPPLFQAGETPALQFSAGAPRNQPAADVARLAAGALHAGGAEAGAALLRANLEEIKKKVTP